MGVRPDVGAVKLPSHSLSVSVAFRMSDTSAAGPEVASLELFKVPPRWLFLKITTADGIEGGGEPVVEGWAESVAAAVLPA